MYNTGSKFAFTHCLSQKVWVIRCLISAMFSEGLGQTAPSVAIKVGPPLFVNSMHFCLIPDVVISRTFLQGFFSYLQASIKMHRYFVSVHNLIECLVS